MSSTKLAIAISLDQFRDLVKEFAREHEQDEELRISLEWTFELFLQWLVRKRQETTNGTTEG